MTHPAPPGVSYRELALFALPAALLLALTYNSVLRYEYGMWDDYTLLMAARHEQTIQFRLLSGNGRPLQDLLSTVLFRWAGDVAGLAWIRGLSLVGLALFCVLLYRGLRQVGWWRLEAGAIALGICTLPAFGVHVGWATMFHGIFGAVAGWLAGAIMGRAPTRGWREVVLAAAGLLVALMFYQPAASFYWLAVAVALFPPGRVVGDALNRALRAGGVFVATLAGYFVLIRLARRWWLTDPIYVFTDARSRLTDDPLGKLDWFLREPLLLGASVDGPGVRQWLAGAVLALVAMGMLAYLLRSAHWRALPVWLGLPLAAMASNLLVAENATFYRVLAPLSAVLGLLLVWSLYRLVQPRSHRLRRGFALLLALLALASGYTTHRDVREHIALLQSREWAMVRAVLAEHYDADDRVLVLARPVFRHTLADQLPGLEYGMLSTSLPMGEIYQLAFASVYDPMAAPRVYICRDLYETRDCPEVGGQERFPVVDLGARLEVLRH